MLCEPLAELDPTPIRETLVGYEHVGLYRLDEVDPPPARAGGANDMDLRVSVEDRAQPGRDDVVGLDDERSCGTHQVLVPVSGDAVANGRPHRRTRDLSSCLASTKVGRV
jgi:hypothetical protein